MISSDEKVIVLKNDAVGDLTQSLKAINNIVNFHINKNIEIYLSERSEKFSFLIDNDNIIYKKINFDLNFIEKIKFIFYLLKNNIKYIYILAPKNFYFYLPFLFRNIKFYALCINGPNDYKRPSQFLRKYLFRYVINNREAVFKREHTTYLQDKLTKENGYSNINNTEFKIKPSELLSNNLPKNYAYFHFKKDIINKLDWNNDDLLKLFDFFLKHYDNLVFTKDIEKNTKDNFLKQKFRIVDFKNKKILNQNLSSKILLYDNIEGEDLYSTIINSSKVIAFHGMMTNLASIKQKKTIDMWF